MSAVGVFRKLEALYRDMQTAYDQVASALDFTCDGCPDNCCVSYFQHHTYVEWAYLMKGVDALPAEKRDEFTSRAVNYVDQAGLALARGERPRIMCPLCVDGRCGMYGHRLMICRLHGVAHNLAGPGGARAFPGCFRFEEIGAGQEFQVLDRTPLYRRLAALEMQFLGSKRGRLPKVDLTLAEMLIKGAPSLKA